MSGAAPLYRGSGGTKRSPDAIPGRGATLSFTLVVATLHRVAELDRLLESLTRQRHRRFEVIVVDQNGDDRLAPLVERFERTLAIERLTSSPGLSRARNLGIRHSSGDVLAFPDDDCVYPPNLLEQVAGVLSRAPGTGAVAVLPRSPEGRPFPHFDRRGGPLNRWNAFRRCSSIGLFVRRSVLDAVGDFNESLGLGAGTLWGAGEDVDLPLRALSAGIPIEYHPGITVVHRIGVNGTGPSIARRGYSYGAGLGWIMRHHQYPSTFAFHHLVLRPFGGMLLGALRGRWSEARFYAASLQGRIRGWIRA